MERSTEVGRILASAAAEMIVTGELHRMRTATGQAHANRVARIDRPHATAHRATVARIGGHHLALTPDQPAPISGWTRGGVSDLQTSPRPSS